MNEQPQSAPASARQQADDPLTWQYILLIIIVAVALVPAIGSTMGNLSRGSLNLPFDQLTLTNVYEDPTGIAVSYPQGWEAAFQQIGAFRVTNAPNAQVIRAVGEVIVDFRLLTLDNLSSIVGTGLESGAAPQDILALVFADASAQDESFDVTALTVHDKQAAHVFFADAGMDVNLLLLDLEDDFYLVVQASTLEGAWDQFSSTFERMLATLSTDLAPDLR